MTTAPHDLTWFLKWTATVILIIGTGVNSFGFYPAGPILLIVGGIFWLAVSIRWHETSLIVTNSIMVITGSVGVLMWWLNS